jgi:uncharacterized membrane protein
LLFNLASAILHIIFAAIPFAGWALSGLWLFVSAVVHLGLFVLMIIAMVKAFSGVRWDIPYVGPIARKQVGEV